MPLPVPRLARPSRIWPTIPIDAAGVLARSTAIGMAVAVMPLLLCLCVACEGTATVPECRAVCDGSAGRDGAVPRDATDPWDGSSGGDGSTTDDGGMVPDGSRVGDGSAGLDARVRADGSAVPDGGAGSDAGALPDAGIGDSAPTGVADAYETYVDSPIEVGAPGVLGNDVDPESDPLSADLLSRPLHGELTLGLDGSLRYRPEAGFVGDDRFTYRPRDTTSPGTEVTVTLTVRASEVEETVVILVHDPDNAEARPPVGEMEARLDTVSDYFAEYSYNTMRTAGVLRPGRGADVVGWYRTSGDSCFDLSEYMDLADEDVDFSRYDRMVIVLAKSPGCSLAAWGSPGRVLVATPDGSHYMGWAKLSLPNASPGTLTHELGHTMRNGHGYFLDCGDVSWAASGCTPVAYGDPYDNMSVGIGHWAARRKSFMDWFNPVSNRMLVVQESGDYVVEPLETNTGGIKALEIPRGGGYPAYVELRQPLGTDTSFGTDADAFDGVLIHVAGHLIDATPPAAAYGPLPPTDAQLTPALHPGQTWTDPATGMSIRLMSISGAGATVHVEHTAMSLDVP